MIRTYAGHPTEMSNSLQSQVYFAVFVVFSICFVVTGLYYLRVCIFLILNGLLHRQMLVFSESFLDLEI